MRRWAAWLALVAAVVAVAVASGRGGDDGKSLDPRSTGPTGAKAVVTLLRELGATVDTTDEAPSPQATTALLLADRMGTERRSALRRWVRSGGTLLVADPASELVPPPVRTGGFTFDQDRDDERAGRRCDEPALGGVRRLSAEQLVPLRLPAGATGCLRRGDGYLIVVRPEGAGRIVAVGGAAPFLNAKLDEDDNSVLAATVLAPDPGRAVVAFMQEGTPGTGDRSLLDLVDRRVRHGLWQLAIAFLVLVWWQARRLGSPVLEPQPVAVPGSELVVAVGSLLQRARRRDQAADMLRGDVRRTLSERLGLPLDAPVDTVADAAAARTGVDSDLVRQVLEPRLLSGDRDLVTLAQAAHALRREVTDAD